MRKGKLQIPPRRCASVGMTKGRLVSRLGVAMRKGKLQIPPLRSASVGMTKGRYAPVPRHAGTGGMTDLFRSRIGGLRQFFPFRFGRCANAFVASLLETGWQLTLI
jgi:hypothetical protein